MDKQKESLSDHENCAAEDRLFNKTSISGSCEVISDVFHVYTSNLKQLVILSMVFYLSTYGLFLIIGIGLLAEESGAISKIINQIPGIHLPDPSASSSMRTLQYGGRLLAAATSNEGEFEISGLSRLLQVDTGDIFEVFQNLGFFKLFIFLLLIVVSSGFVSAVYNGAATHLVAEFYSGETTRSDKSFKYGWTFKWSVFSNAIVLLLVLLGSGMLFVGVPFFLAIGYQVDNGDDGITTAMQFAILVICLYIIALWIALILFKVTVPAIIIEKSRPMQAFRRSYDLCKSNFFFIFCALLGLKVILMIPTIVYKAVVAAIGINPFLSDLVLNCFILPMDVV